MGNPFKKVRPGQKLEIPAEAFNTFIDAALDLKARQRNVDQRSEPARPSTTVIKVRNQSGSDRLRFEVLGLDQPIILPDANPQSFQNEPAFRGVTPTADHRGRFAVLLEPVAAGEIAHSACVSGVTVALVHMRDPGHQYADIAHDTCEYLESCEAGGAAILWREAAEGVTWALVRLGNVADDICRFRLVEQIARCGAASAERIICLEQQGGLSWCQSDRAIEVVDSLGIVPPAGLSPGAFGWARWMADSRSWEVLSYGEGCCGSGSSSISESSFSSESSISESSFSSESSHGSSQSRSSESSLSESSASASSASASSVSESSPPSESSTTSASAPSESGPPSSAPSESAPPPSASSWGSDKSTAIVPAGWTPGGYTALFTLESPEVLFEDIRVARLPQKAASLPIDPRFAEVCEPGSLVVSACVADLPVVVGASVEGNWVRVRFAVENDMQEVRLVLRLTGVRRGFAGLRFPNRSRRQFEANEAFINSAYPAE